MNFSEIIINSQWCSREMSLNVETKFEKHVLGPWAVPLKIKPINARDKETRYEDEEVSIKPLFGTGRPKDRV